MLATQLETDMGWLDCVCQLVSEYAVELTPLNVPRAIVRLKPGGDGSVDYDVPLCSAGGRPLTLIEALTSHYESDVRPWGDGELFVANGRDVVFKTDPRPNTLPESELAHMFAHSSVVDQSTLVVSLFRPFFGCSHHMIKGTFDRSGCWVPGIDHRLDVDVRLVVLYVDSIKRN
jgi:hypothetical protein